MKPILSRILAALALVLVSACTPAPPDPASRDSDIAALARAIEALGPEVDPEEASRAASIAHTYPLRLAEAWQVTDPPLIHNAKVLNGLREKGLCNDWAGAMLTRLSEENFRTLSLHWSTSPPGTFRVIHHSAVISAKGDTRDDGIVLDPWRYGGPLYWSSPEDDDRYDWGPPILAKRKAG